MLHIRRRRFTGVFGCYVGMVGNEGHDLDVRGAFSKCPDVHRRVLEIEDASEDAVVE